MPSHGRRRPACSRMDEILHRTVPIRKPNRYHPHIPNIGLVTDDGKFRPIGPGAHVLFINRLLSYVSGAVGRKPHGVVRPELLKSFRVIQEGDAPIELVQFFDSRQSSVLLERRGWRRPAALENSFDGNAENKGNENGANPIFPHRRIVRFRSSIGQ